MFGRRRPLGDIDSTNAMQRIAAENMAVNTPIQGAAADIVKRAMLAVQAAIEQRGLQSKLLLQVHDELVLDVPDDQRIEVERLLRAALEALPQGLGGTYVPLAALSADELLTLRDRGLFPPQPRPEQPLRQAGGSGSAGAGRCRYGQASGRQVQGPAPGVMERH